MTRMSFGISPEVERTWKIAKLTFSHFKGCVTSQNKAHLAFSLKREDGSIITTGKVISAIVVRFKLYVKI